MKQNLGTTSLFLTCFISYLGTSRSQVGDVGCYVDGQCLDSVTTGFSSSDSAATCHDFCQETAGCNYFTHYASDQLCFAFLDCLNFSQGDCSDCVTGDGSCPALQCGIPGECVGTLMGYSTVPTSGECASTCDETEGCSWWTYESLDSHCTMFRDCLATVDCPSCTSGQEKCVDSDILAPSGEEDRLFVSGMPPTAVDLSHAGSTCEPIAAQLADRQFGVMMKSKLGYPIACGGSEPSCEKYNPESGSWELMPESMSSSRQYGRAVLINDGQDYWITGGGVTKSATTTSEFFNIEAEVFRPGPELPGEFSSHCSAAIDGNRAALIGGFVNINFIYDFAADSFTELPPLNTARRGTFCGIADSGRGQEIVVAGGYDVDPISEFFNFDTMEWSYGPNIYEGDLNYCYGASVPYQGSFLLAGGFRTQDSIYFYDSDAFVLLDQRLVEGGWENPALLVDDKIVNCSS